jgi:hypothetical protein
VLYALQIDELYAKPDRELGEPAVSSGGLAGLPRCLNRPATRIGTVATQLEPRFEFCQRSDVHNSENGLG